MGKAYRIAADVKAEIIRRIKEEGIPVAQAAKEHGVHETTIYNWLTGFAKGAPSLSEFNRLKKERDDLIKLVGELTVRSSTTQKKSW